LNPSYFLTGLAGAGFAGVGFATGFATGFGVAIVNTSSLHTFILRLSTIVALSLV
jgi:hypothetical protein